MIESYVNKYNDIVLKIPSNLSNIQEHYFDANHIRYDPCQGYIVHLELCDETVPLFPEDFSFVSTRNVSTTNNASTTNNTSTNSNIKTIYIYANECVLNKCPEIVDNKVSGSTVVTTVSTSESPTNVYLVLVKDRTKDKLTNPCGTKNSRESYEECAERELREETNLRLFSKLIEIGSMTYIANVHDFKWDGDSMIYYTHVFLTEKRLLELKSYSCDEIEKVCVYPITIGEWIKKENVESFTSFKVSNHHLVSANHALGKLWGKKYDWESEYESYLKEFKLY